MGWSCPVCKQPLIRKENVYRCGDGHCFDVAAAGYVNLLAGRKRHSKQPGDNPDMIRARHNFLEKGYYAPFREALAGMVERLRERADAVLLDAGCGEGYYTRAFSHKLREGEVLGVDLSKTGVARAAKRDRDGNYAVASLFDLPLGDGQADFVTDIFAPVCAPEFERVLKPGGYLLVAGPTPRHLYGLKELLYDCPYENERESAVSPGFSLVEETDVETVLDLGQQDLRDLYYMTPYCFNSHRRALERLEGVSSLRTEAGFCIRVFRCVK